jgi:hypothetical protein
MYGLWRINSKRLQENDKRLQPAALRMRFCELGCEPGGITVHGPDMIRRPHHTSCHCRLSPSFPQHRLFADRADCCVTYARGGAPLVPAHVALPSRSPLSASTRVENVVSAFFIHVLRLARDDVESQSPGVPPKLETASLATTARSRSLLECTRHAPLNLFLASHHHCPTRLSLNAAYPSMV